MSFFPFRRALAGLAAAVSVAALGQTAEAGIFHTGGKAAAVSAARISEIQRALDEQRLMDAGRLIDEDMAAGSRDPQLRVMAGELGLLRGRYDAALQDFKAAETAPQTAAAALQGQGVALARMGRNDEAVAELQKAVTAAPGSWRAWNALGSEYDLRRDWPHATEAYAKAIAGSNGSALVLNNRGYSQLLQGRFADAIADFVAALQKKPDLTEARTNLRLAMALNGDYARSIAGADPENRAALLNNAGFAAGIRGDYAKAENLLDEALQARGEFYDRASQNLKVIHTLEAAPKTAKHDPE